MPRTKGTNKSQAIRNLLSGNPELKAKEVVSTLNGKGIKVNDSLVYFIKGKMKVGKQRRKKVIGAARAAVSSNGDPVTLIREIKAMAEKTGGIGKLKDLVEALAE